MLGDVTEIRTGISRIKRLALPLEFTSSVMESEVVLVLSQALNQEERPRHSSSG
jgi:hypothetical protein